MQLHPKQRDSLRWTLDLTIPWKKKCSILEVLKTDQFNRAKTGDKFHTFSRNELQMRLNTNEKEKNTKQGSIDSFISVASQVSLKDYLFGC